MFSKKSIIIVLAIAIISVVVFFVYLSKRNNATNIQIQPAVEDAKNAVPTEEENLNASIEQTKLTDKDLDGLTDEEEKKLGTKIDVADSDGDGVLDSDEVNGYKTNPNKADSDGDGYEDGYEIRRGYNPLGSGNLKN